MVYNVEGEGARSINVDECSLCKVNYKITSEKKCDLSEKSE